MNFPSDGESFQRTTGPPTGAAGTAEIIRTYRFKTAFPLAALSFFFLHIHAVHTAVIPPERLSAVNIVPSALPLRGAETSHPKVEKPSLAHMGKHLPKPAGIERKAPAMVTGPYTLPDITRGEVSDMEIALTFDGGSDSGDTLKILETLKERGIRTTMFLTGAFMEKYPELVKRMIEDGHEIGNHTMSHPHLTDYQRRLRHTSLPGVTREFVRRELAGAAGIFKRITGRDMAPLWRAPYGEINAEIRQWALEEGYVHVGWTVDRERKESLDTLDWVDDVSSRLYLTSAGIRDRILGFGSDGYGLRGGIILMHLSSPRPDDRPSEVLGEIMDELRRRGYGFVKVSELLRRDGRIYTALKDRARVAMGKN